MTRKRLKDPGNNIGNPLQTVFMVQNLAINFNFRRGNHPSLADKVLCINLNVICVIQIISATLLVISISELKNINCRASATGAHGKGCHGISIPEPLKQFSVLKKCQGKLDCLIPKMLFIHERKLKLNTQCAHTNSLADVKTTT